MLTAPGAAAPAVDLTPRFHAGSITRYEHVLTLTQTQEIDRFAKATASLRLESSLRFEVTRTRPDGSAELQLIFDRLYADLVRPGLPRVIYDSAAPEPPDAPPMARTLARVAATPVVYDLDAGGRVIAMFGAREIARLVAGREGADLIAGVFSEPFFAELARDLFAPAGEGADADEAWTSELAVPLGGLPGAVTTVTWRVEGVEDGRALITGVGQTSYTRVEHPLLRGLAQRVSGETSLFEIRWDLEAGRAERIEKARAVKARFNTGAGELGSVTLGTYSLLTRRGR